MDNTPYTVYESDQFLIYKDDPAYMVVSARVYLTDDYDDAIRQAHDDCIEFGHTRVYHNGELIRELRHSI